jgi:hypothetical protein
MNATTINTNDADNTRSNVPEKYNKLRQDLERILIAYSTPEIKFFGVSEIYEINYTLNQYGLMLKRSLYRLFITVAIMDSIGTRLGTQMSYMQHMTDMVVAIFNIKLDEPDSDDESESESESES